MGQLHRIYLNDLYLTPFKIMWAAVKFVTGGKLNFISGTFTCCWQYIFLRRVTPSNRQFLDVLSIEHVCFTQNTTQTLISLPQNF